MGQRAAVSRKRIFLHAIPVKAVTTGRNIRRESFCLPSGGMACLPLMCSIAHGDIIALNHSVASYFNQKRMGHRASDL